MLQAKSHFICNVFCITVYLSETDTDIISAHSAVATTASATLLPISYNISVHIEGKVLLLYY